MLLPPKLEFAAPKLPQPGSVRVVCMCDAPGEVWPEYTAFPPRHGDMVQSEMGMTRKISEVIHTVDTDGNPLVVLRLGIPGDMGQDSD